MVSDGTSSPKASWINRMLDLRRCIRVVASALRKAWSAWPTMTNLGRADPKPPQLN